MNGRLELRTITQPYSEVYWGYFRRLVFGKSLTKHSKLSSFSYSVVISFLPISHIPPCFHANPPDFPRLIGPRESADHCGHVNTSSGDSGVTIITRYEAGQQNAFSRRQNGFLIMGRGASLSEKNEPK